MYTVPIELAIQIAANAVVVALFFGKLNTKIAVLQTKLSYLERRLKESGTLPADL
jgi:hypothetical protein